MIRLGDFSLTQQPRARVPWRPMLVGFLIATLAAEGLGRSVVRLSLGSTSDQVFGQRHKAGPYVYSSEGFSRGRFTASGFRDYEMPQPSPYAQDVVLYGDSYTEAIQIPAKSTFPHIAQEQAPQYRFHVYGISGGSFAQYIAWNKTLRQTLHPASAVFVLNWTDFTIDVNTDLHASARAYARMVAPHQYETYVNPHAANPRLKSGKMVDRVLSNCLPLLLMGLVKGDAEGGPATAAAGPHDDRLNVDYLDWCMDQVRHAAPKVLVVYIPTMAYHREPQAEARSLKAEQYLAKYAGDPNFKVVNLRPTFTRLYEQQGIEAHGFPNTMPGDGHINSIGHREVARAIVDGLNALWHSHP